MKTIALAFLSSVCFLNAQVANQPARNEFSMVIEGTNCRIKAYKPTTPIIIDPLVNKDSIPKSPVLVAIMLTHSDISSYMSDEEVSEYTETKFDAEQIQKLRSQARKMFELTGPDAADNPWKGMKYMVDQAFLVESEKSKFLVYQLRPQGTKDINGALTGNLRNVNGKWSIRGAKHDDEQKFQSSMMQLVPAEFAKQREKSSIEPLPLEDLLK